MNFQIVISLCLFVCMSGLLQAACLPATLPVEEDMEEGSRSRSLGSTIQLECSPLNMVELGKLNTQATTDLQHILSNMKQAKNVSDMRLDGARDNLPIGFYGGAEGNDHSQIAAGVTYLCCTVPYILDVMKQEAVNDEMLGVSSFFHAVYDILDPGNDSNLPRTLKKIVLGAQLNSCQITDGSVCSSFSTENHSAAIVVSILAQNLRNLSEDILLSLNRVL